MRSPRSATQPSAGTSSSSASASKSSMLVRLHSVVSLSSPSSSEPALDEPCRDPWREPWRLALRLLPGVDRSEGESCACFERALRDVGLPLSSSACFRKSCILLPGLRSQHNVSRVFPRFSRGEQKTALLYGWM